MTRRMALAPIVSFCLSSAVFAQDVAPLRPRAELGELDGLLEKGDAGAVETLLRRLQPSLDADDRFALDSIYVLLGRRRFDEAREQWGRVGLRIQQGLRAASGDGPDAERELQRRVAEAWFVQGLLTARFGGKEEALRLLRDADGLGFPPLDSPLMRLAADALRDLGEHALAVRAYREIVERHPGDGRARLGLGLSLYASGAVAAARGELEETLRSSPGTPGAHYALGAALFDLKRYAEAKGHLERELARDPACAPCLARLAHLAYLEGDDRQCEAWLARAAAVDAGHVEVSLVSGLRANRDGRYPEAIQLLSRVVERAPGYAMARYQLGLAYQRVGEAGKAREHLEAYRRLLAEEKARTTGVRGSE